MPINTAPTGAPVRVPALSVRADEALQRILIVKLSAMGDVIHALPLAEALRAALPNSHITWLVRRSFADLLHNNPNLDEVMVLERKSWSEVSRFAREARARKFTAALDPQGLFFSGLLARVSGAPLRVGFDLNREQNALFMTHPVVPARERRHMTEKILSFCDVLGLPHPTTAHPQRYLAEGAPEETAALLQEASGTSSGPLAGLIIGASTPTKTWPVERWVEAVRMLAARRVRPVLIGGPAEQTAAAQIVQDAGPGLVALNATGRTSLRVLPALLARCGVAVGADTGALHLAVAVGTPTVGLFGASDPVHSGPHWGAARSIVLDRNTEVAPEARRFRNAPDNAAIARISAEEMVSAVETLLSEGVSHDRGR